MDYINYVKQQPITGMTGFGGGSTGLQFHSGASKATAFRGNRAIIGFYGTPGSTSKNTYYYNLSSTGNATNFGQLTVARKQGASCAGGGGDTSTRSVFGGGYSGNPGTTNVLDYVTIANTGQATDFGDLNYSSSNPGGCCSNGMRGVYANGFDGGGTTYVPTGHIDYFEIDTPANAQDFGDLGNVGQGGSSGQYWGSACGSDEGRGCFGSTNPGSRSIYYIEIPTTGNASNFGQLYHERSPTASCSDGSRGTWWGNGDVAGIDYITMSTTGNATDFGDMNPGVQYAGAAANDTYGTVSGGNNDDGYKNTIQYVSIQTTGNASSFGTISQGQFGNGASGD
tara:strand:+ start:355 stop:1371 length:1017 start_codon:yes stop_codon:yes gene_type:complete